MTSAVHAAARDAHDAGLCVIRAAADGTKKPLGRWKHWQSTRTTRDDIDNWFGGGWAGMGVVCGKVSGNVEMFELEGRAMDEGIGDDLDTAMAAAGLDDLWGRIVGGYTERTPSGGFHVLYRCSEVGPNVELARRPATDDELADNPDDRIKVLIETRGEGGFTIVAPSNGTTHPTGGAWQLELGGFDTIATITREERQALLEVARTFDQMPEEGAPPPPPERPAGFNGSLPGEEFNAEYTGHDVLAAAGFHSPRQDGKGTHYTRPGKDARQSSSATVWADDGTITLFSTSIAAPAEYLGHRRLNPWRAHVALAHAGDHSAAARAWRARHPRERQAPDDSWIHTGRADNGADAEVEAPASDNAVAPPDEQQSSDIRLRPGGGFVLDVPDGIPAVWGRDDEVLWAEGEPLLIVAPPGVGKTTLAGQVLRARLGLDDAVLGYPVQPGERVLYLACDRPRQIARSLRRIFRLEDRATLDERLVVWEGPPPADIAQDTDALLMLCYRAGAGTLFLDSAKDVALGLTDDTVGASFNSAVQKVIAAGIEVCILHHQRKGQNGEKPKKLEDVYGSTWITAGAGSVILLWGQAGDPVVELVHLKQPATDVGPIRVEHDHDAGRSHVLSEGDPLAILNNRGTDGLTANELAMVLTQKNTPSDNDRRRMQRKLDRLVDAGLASVERGSKGGHEGTQPNRYYAADPLPIEPR